MRTVIIKVDSKEAEYIERLDYERGFTKDVLQRIIESHMDDPGVVNSETFKAYQKQGVELDAQFKMAVIVEDEKVAPLLDAFRKLDSQTKMQGSRAFVWNIEQVN